MKNKKGKKLVVLGAMAALLTLIGVSGSQTYAKYVESKTVPSTNATVAQWGFVAKNDSSKLFGKKHDLSVSESTVSDSGNSIVTTGSSAVLAPGSKGFVTFGFEGFAEVITQLTIDITITKDVYLKDGVNDPYHPLVWTYDDGVNAPIVGSLNDIKTALSSPSAYEYIYSANTALTGKEFKLSYEWKFSVNEDTDKLDTDLGRLAAGEDTVGTYTESSYVLNFAIEYTMTQIQKFT